ncbi:MAG: segregation ATPase FtsK/SpoIIIE, family, partial [Dehalococcoidia bacterium]|nr:segregation ATPase FtsK/SpoIIIE, family [Dehalococcoidia bacterium]
AWGVLGMFDAEAGPLREWGMGGRVGMLILGERNSVGMLRLSALGLLSVALLGPGLAWSTVKVTAVSTFRVLRALSERVGILFWSIAGLLGRWLIKATTVAMKGLSRAAVVGASVLKSRLSLLRASLRNVRTSVKREDGPIANPPLLGSAESEAKGAQPPVLGGAGPVIAEPFIDEAGEQDSDEKPTSVSAGKRSFSLLGRKNGGLGEADVELAKTADAAGWRLPSTDILDKDTPRIIEKVDNDSKARAIEAALASYGIDASVVEINPGPAVTQFGVEPGWVRKFRDNRVRDEHGKLSVDERGNPLVRREEVSKTRVKVDAIANLDKDLAMALAAPSIRIEAPIPGKSMVGVEVPNNQSETVTLRSGINSLAFQKLKDKSKLAIVLGKGSGGQPEVADLAKMPHLLVAGATGSGKSIGLRSILVSLLMYATPRELRLVLIDPKRVELVAFNGIPHLIGPVIVDVEKVVDALRWAIQEMEERYKKFAAVGARNVDSYNKSKQVVEPFPYLLIMIDELADLMMAAPYDVEHSITRLAQLGRATGIHLVVATQRPSVDVVTGLIKANFPTRLSFAVSSLVDSRTILDTMGAEKLLGKGDMLYLPQDAPKPKRIQGVYVSDGEVDRVVRAWSQQRKELPPSSLAAGVTPGVPFVSLPTPAATSTMIPVAASTVAMMSASPMATSTAALVAPPPPKIEKDPLMPKAREIAEQFHKISPSLLQRKLKVGYNKAVYLVALLEEEGYGEADDDDPF